MAKMAQEEVDTSLPMEDCGFKMKKRKIMMTKKQEVKRDDLVGFTSSESSSSEDEEEDEKAVPSSKPSLEKVVNNPSSIDKDDKDDEKVKEEDFKTKKPTEPEELSKPSSKPDSCLPAGLERVLVERPPDVEEARARLPVVAEEQVIMETIGQYQVTILSGETGSGKTTQLPQFLYEGGCHCHGQQGRP